MAKATSGKKAIISDDDVDQLLQPHQTTKEMAFMRLQSLYEMSRVVRSNTDMQPQFRARFRDIVALRTAYESAMSEMICVQKRYNASYVPSYDQIKAFDEMYYSVCDIADSLNLSGSDNTRCDFGSGKTVKPRLPKLEIFHFDGKLENWPTFRDTFTSLVHSNTDIVDIEKFYYLLSAVSGPALTIVKSMPITATNYSIVWNSLVTRFENKRALATTYLDKVFSFKPLQYESVDGLNAFLQACQDSVKALKSLDIPDLSSFVLFYVALRNLDSTTRRAFENKSVPGDLPTFEGLIAFVENQVRILEMSESKSVSNQSIDNAKPIYAKGYQNTSRFDKKLNNSNARVGAPRASLASAATAATKNLQNEQNSNETLNKIKK